MSNKVSEVEGIKSFFKMLKIIENVEKDQNVDFNELESWSKPVSDAIIDSTASLLEVGIVVAPQTIMDTRNAYIKKMNLEDKKLLIGDDADINEYLLLLLGITKYEVQKYANYLSVFCTIYDTNINKVKNGDFDESIIQDKESFIKYNEEILEIFSVKEGVSVINWAK